ncbi:type II secretion system inner membrane protein GspF [Burkholderiaceae bacterium DAT-1]|nr:type II secretion system inner membrane protein GspF [Burkholderiaceae bacterium DAT-1]
MAGFRYRGIDARGKQVEGVVEADTAKLARANLRDQGIWVSDMSEIKADETGQPGKSSRAAIPTAALALLTRQFATLLDAGLTIEQSLNVLIEQAENPRIRDVLAGVRSEILAGSPMSVAMSRHPRVFPELYRTIVRAGEESGRAAEVMRRLADYIEARQALASKVGQAFVYPIVLVVVCLLIVTGMLYWVVPQMVAVFESQKATLPLLTRALLAVSNFVRHDGIYLIASLGVIGAVCWKAMQKEHVRIKVDRAALSMPLFGRFNRTGNTARLASTLSILVGSGVPLLTAMSAAGGVVQNRVMRAAVADSSKDVREGASLSVALGRKKLFPPVLIHLIASGEASGRLEVMLEKAAQQQSAELEQRVGTFTSLLAPLMALFMGVVVLLIVLAILLPVFEMNELVK